MSPSELSDVIMAVAQAGHRPSTEWLAAFADACATKLHLLRPRQLASIIASFARLDYHPGDDWLDGFDATCFSHPGPWDPQAVSDVLLSMALLPNGGGSSAGGSMDEPSGSFYRFSSVAYLKVLRKPHQFSYCQLSLILRCLSQLAVDLDDEFLTAAGEAMGRRLAEMAPEEARQVALQRVRLAF